LETKVIWSALLADKRVALEPTSKQELDELREMAALNLNDAQVPGLSAQGQYEHAYNSARLIATTVIRACGYRVTSKGGHHYYTFRALEAADLTFAKAAANFDAARSKRNDFSYDTPITISDTDADDLIQAVKQFQQDAESWIHTKNPRLA
jgi:hypothetical protein